MTGEPDIDLTRDMWGGPLRNKPVASTDFTFKRGTRVILIHGFDTKRIKAAKNYAAFMANAQAVAPRFGNDLLTLVWPSDTKYLNYYAKNVENAEECAHNLAWFIAEYIRKELPTCDYVFIAHSMGCRLVIFLLTELKRLKVKGYGEFRIFLMAAAVPVEMMKDHRITRALQEIKEAAVLYSSDDDVLKIPFWAGEKTVGYHNAEAVGLYGRPEKGVWSRHEKMRGFGHGTYWQDKRTPERIAALLGYATDRSIQEHRTPERAPFDERNLL